MLLAIFYELSMDNYMTITTSATNITTDRTVILATISVSLDVKNLSTSIQYFAITQTLVFDHIHKFTANILTNASCWLIRWVDFCFEYLKDCRVGITI